MPSTTIGFAGMSNGAEAHLAAWRHVLNGHAARIDVTNLDLVAAQRLPMH